MGKKSSALNKDEEAFYSRHLSLPEVGRAGQEKLKAASVLLVGAGGLGSPAALYLAAAGIGHLGVIDPDRVDVSNLHRQVLYGISHVQQPKVAVAALRLQDLNPHIEITTYDEPLTTENARELIGQYDLVLDGADNFPTRYLVNDASVLEGVPNVHGAIHKFEGQVSVYGGKDGPCYRCLYPEPPAPGEMPSCAEAGVLGVLPGMIGTIQATEAVKLILGIGKPLIGRVLQVDALTMEFRVKRLVPDRDCPVCGREPTITSPGIHHQESCQARPDAPPEAGPETIVEPQPTVVEEGSLEITPEELRRRLERKEPIFLLDVREPYEYDAFRIEGATLIPLRLLPDKLDTLDKQRNIVVYCHSGVRSMRATLHMRDHGFASVRNLAGGVVAWQRVH